VLHSLFAKLLRDWRMLLLGTALGLALYTLLVMGIFQSIRQPLEALEASQPPPLLRALGADQDPRTTLPDWLNVTGFSLAFPGALSVLAIFLASRAIAGEIESGALDLLLSRPLPRARLVWQSFAALFTGLALQGVVIWLEVAALALAWRIPIDLLHLAGAALNLVLLSLVFGAFALALGCLLGRQLLTRWITLGLLLFLCAADLLADLWQALRPLQVISPFSYYNAANPLSTGLNPLQTLILAALCAVFLAVTLITFERREL